LHKLWPASQLRIVPDAGVFTPMNTHGSPPLLLRPNTNVSGVVAWYAMQM
jgi:hypothetical protein